MSCFRICGQKLRLLRVKALLTQEQLAHLADCSDRVIRKAESGGTLRLETVELIVDGLRNRGIELTPADLTVGNRRLGNLLLAKKYLRAFDRHGAYLSQHFPHFSRNLRVQVVGKSDIIPFAGSWRGVEGIDRHHKAFFATFRRKTCAVAPTFLESDNEVVVKFTDRWQPRNGKIIPVWVNLHFRMRNAAISRIEMQYDTHLIHQYFASKQFRARKKTTI